MQCLSCHRERGSEFVSGVLLCGGCAPVAKKIEVELDREIEKARVLTKNWLQQHILKGGLIDGSSTRKAKAHAAGILLDGDPVQEVRGETQDPPVAGNGADSGGAGSAGTGAG